MRTFAAAAVPMLLIVPVYWRLEESVSFVVTDNLHFDAAEE
jgi:hypothetical protein